MSTRMKTNLAAIIHAGLLKFQSLQSPNHIPSPRIARNRGSKHSIPAKNQRIRYNRERQRIFTKIRPEVSAAWDARGYGRPRKDS